VNNHGQLAPIHLFTLTPAIALAAGDDLEWPELATTSNSVPTVAALESKAFRFASPRELGRSSPRQFHAGNLQSGLRRS
jgi:hypothetical protein